jgi:hypothetical protein
MGVRLCRPKLDLIGPMLRSHEPRLYRRNPMTRGSVRTATWTMGIVAWLATQAVAQVRVEARTERLQYLHGEPIVVIVSFENVGDEAFGYCACEGDIRLTVIGVQRRTLPNIDGCGGGGEVSGGGVSITGHPPMLQPGESTAFRYLLKQYDVAPGRHSVRVSGKAAVRWKYYPWALPPSGPKHKETDPVPGADIDHTFSARMAST